MNRCTIMNGEIRLQFLHILCQTTYVSNEHTLKLCPDQASKLHSFVIVFLRKAYPFLEERVGKCVDFERYFDFYVVLKCSEVSVSVTDHQSVSWSFSKIQFDKLGIFFYEGHNYFSNRNLVGFCLSTKIFKNLVSLAIQS